jgi:hypothetical protein
MKAFDTTAAWDAADRARGIIGQQYGEKPKAFETRQADDRGMKLTF